MFRRKTKINVEEEAPDYVVDNDPYRDYWKEIKNPIKNIQQRDVDLPTEYREMQRKELGNDPEEYDDDMDSQEKNDDPESPYYYDDEFELSKPGEIEDKMENRTSYVPKSMVRVTK